jgi:hypothetical protein
VESQPFRVSDWDGITVDDARLEGDRRVSFAVGPRHVYEGSEIGPIDYPDSYASPVRFIRDERTFVRDPDAPSDPSRFEWYCLDCTFRPWADAGDASAASVVFVSGSATRAVAAHESGGRWVSDQPLPAGSVAVVGSGCVRDAFGDVNGSPSAAVGGALPSGVDARCGGNGSIEGSGSGGGGGSGSASSPEAASAPPPAPESPLAPGPSPSSSPPFPASIPVVGPVHKPRAKKHRAKHRKRHKKRTKHRHRRR